MDHLAEAARRGCKVVLACPKKHAGGMAASGLSTTDAVRREIFGGLVVLSQGSAVAPFIYTLF